MKKGLVTNVQFHSEGKEMALMDFNWGEVWHDQIFILQRSPGSSVEIGENWGTVEMVGDRS